jgi:hypothetical protein
MEILVFLILAALLFGDFGNSTKSNQDEQTRVLNRILEELKKKNGSH